MQNQPSFTEKSSPLNNNPRMNISSFDDRRFLKLLIKIKAYNDSIYSSILSVITSTTKFLVICVSLINHRHVKVEGFLRMGSFFYMALNFLHLLIHTVKVYSVISIRNTNELRTRLSKLWQYDQISYFLMLAFFTYTISLRSVGYNASDDTQKLYDTFLLVQFCDFMWMCFKSLIVTTIMFSISVLSRVEEGHKHKNESSDNEGECSICMEMYKKDEYFLTLVCGHVFHYDCVTRWIATQSTCPVCKRDLSIEIQVYEGEDLKL